MEKERSKTPVEKQTLPVVEEELLVGKRTVETGITRVSKKVRSSEKTIREPLMKDTVDVQRVAVNRYIDSPVGVRTEGDVTIIPVLEEVLFVQKRLRLKEELHIRRRREAVTHIQKETVRKEEAVVEHEDLTH